MRTVRNQACFTFYCLILIVCSSSYAQSRINTLTIQSSWGGLGQPARSDLTVQRKGAKYLSEQQSLSSDLINKLLSAIEEPPISKPSATNLGITSTWLINHIDEAGASAGRLHYKDGLPEQQALFQKAFANESTLSSRLNHVYERSHTDDYPRMHVRLILENGSRITLATNSQNPYMLPWKVTANGRTQKTYNAKISSALLALIPAEFANRKRLAGNGLPQMIGEETATRIESRWKMLRAQHDSGDALSILGTAYKVHGATVNSYHGLAFGKAWDGAEPYEENLQVDLEQQGFPKGFVIGAVLLRENGKTEGANNLLRSAPAYVKLVMSVPWLNRYIRTHPEENEWLFYVHGESLTEKGMRIFADDMKSIGRDDLIERVRTVQHQAALLETGQGDYWIILPDKTAILWRWQSLNHVLNWKPSEFPTHRCTDYNTVSGGCAGRVIAADGIPESARTIPASDSR